MTAQLIIPIEGNPRLTQNQLDAFIAHAHSLGRNPDELLAQLLVEAIKTSEQLEGADKTALAA